MNSYFLGSINSETAVHATPLEETIDEQSANSVREPYVSFDFLFLTLDYSPKYPAKTPRKVFLSIRQQPVSKGLLKLESTASQMRCVPREGYLACNSHTAQIHNGPSCALDEVMSIAGSLYSPDPDEGSVHYLDDTDQELEVLVRSLHPTAN